jgi:hypothetical protein
MDWDVDFYFGFEIHAALIMKSAMFWDVMLGSPVDVH